MTHSHGASSRGKGRVTDVEIVGNVLRIHSKKPKGDGGRSKSSDASKAEAKAAKPTSPLPRRDASEKKRAADATLAGGGSPRLLPGPAERCASAMFSRQAENLGKSYDDGCGAIDAILKDPRVLRDLPGAAVTINTVGYDIQLEPAVRTSSAAFIDIEVLQELLEKPEAVAYSGRVLGWQPSVCDKRFNDSKGVTIAESGLLSKNKIHAKFFKTMKIQVAGPKSTAEFLGVAEYLRGLVQAVLGYAVKLDSLKLHNINGGLNLGMKLDRQVLTDQLLALMEDGEWQRRNVRHQSVEFNPFGDEAYAGIKMRLLVETGSGRGVDKSPMVLMFQSGYVMIMASSFRVLRHAVRYMSTLAHRGLLKEASERLLSMSDGADGGGLGDDEIRKMLKDEMWLDALDPSQPPAAAAAAAAAPSAGRKRALPQPRALAKADEDDGEDEDEDEARAPKRAAKNKPRPRSGALERLAKAGPEQGEKMELSKRGNPAKVIDALIDSLGDE